MKRAGAIAASPAVLDGVFWALSDATRRDVVARLTQGRATVSELAQPYSMSLPGFMKHLRVLEASRLVLRAKEGRSVFCELAPSALEDAAMWLATYEKFWTPRLDALGRFLYHQKETQPWPEPARKAAPSSTSGGTTTPRPRKSGGRGPSRKR